MTRRLIDDPLDPGYAGPLCVDCAYCGDKYGFPTPNALIDVDPDNPLLRHYYCCCGDCDFYYKDVAPLGIHECEHFEQI